MGSYGRWSEGDPYENLRGVLAEDYAALPPEQLEQVLVRSGMSPEDIEDFMSTLGQIGRGIAGALPTVLPAVGTVVGTAFGGPAGAALGGMAGRLAGGAIAGAVQPQPGGVRPAPPPRRPRVQPRPQQVMAPRIAAPPRPAAPAAVARPAVPAATPAPVPAGAPAANQLLQTLFRPETLQALLAMALGNAGRGEVPVGDTPVPVGAFANLIGVLAGQAGAELPAADPGGDGGGDGGNGSGEDYPAYLAGPGGAPMVDPAVPEERAAALLHHLARAEAMEAAYGEADDEDYGEDDEDWQEDDEDWGEDDLESMYDEAELEDLYESDLEGAYDAVYG
ncbi:MAG TPA: hypothetical protein VF092_19975 [Longimicrobium sp.]